MDVGEGCLEFMYILTFVPAASYSQAYEFCLLCRVLLWQIFQLSDGIQFIMKYDPKSFSFQTTTVMGKIDMPEFLRGWSVKSCHWDIHYA